jgi:hypothetical protein
MYLIPKFTHREFFVTFIQKKTNEPYDPIYKDITTKCIIYMAHRFIIITPEEYEDYKDFDGAVIIREKVIDEVETN